MHERDEKVKKEKKIAVTHLSMSVLRGSLKEEGENEEFQIHDGNKQTSNV